MCIRDRLASAEERNRESFNPDVDLGPEPVTEKSAKISKKKADIVQFDNVDKNCLLYTSFFFTSVGELLVAHSEAELRKVRYI